MPRSGAPSYFQSWAQLGLLVYIALYCCYSNFGNPAVASFSVARAWARWWDPLLGWVGRELLQLGNAVISVQPTGSGDRLGNYLQVGVIAGMAGLVALLWAGWARGRGQERRTHELVRIYTRYTLAIAMLHYGWAKVFHVQMLAPGPGRLMEAYGESAPMGLLWTALGYSAGYSFCIGAAEVVAGLLLFFRRSTSLGALLTFGIMLQVALMNFCFDVPVKLYSVHLTLLALWLAGPDLGRLASLLWWRRATDAAVIAPRSVAVFGDAAEATRARLGWRGSLAKAATGLKVLVIGMALFSAVGGSLNVWHNEQRKSEFYGLYRVERIVRDEREIPLLVSDATLWRRVAVDDFGGWLIMTVRTMDERTRRFVVEARPTEGALALTAREAEKPVPVTFRYRWAETDRLVLEGPWDGQHLAVELRREPSEHLLLSRGFHWINETPYNPGRP